MKNYACYNSDGQYIVSGISEKDLTPYDIPDNCSVYYGVVDIVNQYHNIETNTPTEKGVPPSKDGYNFSYVTKTWDPNNNYMVYKIKSIRDQKLFDSDWTDTITAPSRLGKELYDQWQTYRQALRDIPKQSGYPFNVVFPTPPN